MEGDLTQNQQIPQQAPIEDSRGYTPVGLPDPKAKIKKIIKIGLIVALLLGAVNGFIYWQRRQSVNEGARLAMEANQVMEEIKARRAEKPKIVLYQNSELSFSVSYPEAWITEKCLGDLPGQGIVAFGEPKEGQNLIYCNSEFTNSAPVFVQTIVTTEVGQYTSSVMNGLEGAIREDITLDGKPAVKISGKTMVTESGYLPAGLEVIRIISYSGEKVYILGLFEIDGQLMTGDFNKMIESFKFLE